MSAGVCCAMMSSFDVLDMALYPQAPIEARSPRTPYVRRRENNAGVWVRHSNYPVGQPHSSLRGEKYSAVDVGYEYRHAKEDAAAERAAAWHVDLHVS